MSDTAQSWSDLSAVPIPADPLSMLSSGRRRVPMSLSPSTALAPTQTLPTNHTPEPALRFPRAQPNRNPALEVKNSQGNITRAKWKGHTFLLPLPQCFPCSSLLPPAALGCQTCPGSASSWQQPQFPWFCSLPGQGWGQLAPAVRRAQGSPSRGVIPVTSRSHLAATCRELLSQTRLPRLPAVSRGTPALRAVGEEGEILLQWSGMARQRPGGVEQAGD